MRKKYLIVAALMLSLGGGAFAQTIAIVDGEKISKEELNLYARQVTGGRSDFDAIPEEYKKKIIDGVVTKKLLAKEAFKKGITKDKDYKKMLKTAKEDIALQIWQKKLLDGIKVTDKDAREFYKQNKAKLTKPEQVKARHILVKTKKEAEDIIKELKNTPKNKVLEKFKELASSKSIGPSKSRGGDLGTFGKGQMVKEFENEAFSLKEGSFSTTPVKTQFGYHIIFVEKKLKGGVTPFEEVKKQMQEGAKMQKFKETIKNKIDALKKKAKIKILYKGEKKWPKKY